MFYCSSLSTFRWNLLDFIAGTFGESKGIDNQNTPITSDFQKMRFNETCV